MLPALVALALAAGVAPAWAEDGTGPPVGVAVPINAPLTEVLHGSATTDKTSLVATVDIEPSLTVAGATVASLPAVHLERVAYAPIGFTVSVSPGVIAKVRAAAATAHTHRATISWLVTVTSAQFAMGPVTYPLTGALSLEAPRHPHGRVGVAVRQRTIVYGSDEIASGVVSFAAPSGWLRTSRPGSTFATFLVPDGRCDATVLLDANVLAHGRLTAAILTSSTLGGIKALTTPVVHIESTRGWAIGTDFDGVPAATTLVRVAPNRYAGLRIEVQLTPGCAARTVAHLHPALLVAVRSVRGSVHFSRRTCRRASEGLRGSVLKPRASCPTR